MSHFNFKISMKLLELRPHQQNIAARFWWAMELQSSNLVKGKRHWTDDDVGDGLRRGRWNVQLEVSKHATSGGNGVVSSDNRRAPSCAGQSNLHEMEFF